MPQRLTAIISGRVQMVMYRDFVRRQARRLGLTGTVKNLPDGDVAVVAEGAEKPLRQLLGKLHQGPLLAKVAAIDTDWSPATNQFKNFEIVDVD